MQAFLSHIRGRGINHSAAPPLQPENGCVVPPTSALGYGMDSTIETSPAVHCGMINKKILENPSSYLDVDDSEPLPRSLSPRTWRHTVGDSSRGLRNILRAKPIPGSVCEVDKPGSDSAHETTPSELKSIDRLAAPGDWSTFGRKRVRSSPMVPAFADFSPTKDATRRTSYSPSLKRSNSNKNGKGLSSAESSHSVMSSHNMSRSSMVPRDISAQTSNRGHTLTIPDNDHTSSSSIHSKSSPTDSASSRLHPRTPNRPRSNTSPTTRPTAYFTAPILRELGFDSPGTFGHPTPESRSTFTFGHPSPPPPLPPLNHPALSSCLKDKNVNNITPAASGFAERSNSFSKRSSRIPSGIGDDLFASLSMTFSRSVRRSTSLPKVQNTFPSSSEEQPAAQRLRTRTIPDKARLRRRNSASWSAQQATEGVNSSSNTAWPAEVSREMLRLSLGEGLDLVNWPLVSQSGVPGPGSETRGGSMAQFPNQAPISQSFSPPSSPPRPRSPVPQGGEPASQSPSPSLSSNLPPPHHRHPTSYADSRMSANPNGTRVALDGATSPNHTTSRLDVPVGPSKIQGRPSSQFLLPPSTITPTSARTPRTITMNPSTPTPTSRNQSDKIKGKRKAEDIDTTPPEQRKDIQRTTFAVPESNRSQKLSASSHAPSSYHRKRARISSSSFINPIHSRPVSIQSQSTNLEPTPEVGKFGSWSSQTSVRVVSSPSTPSRAASARSTRPHQTPSKNSHTNSITQNQNHARRQSLSQASIPISALVSPHAPSIAPSGTFHMRDPRRPPKKLAETPWTLHFRGEDEPGSPVHAWCFFVGFALFPIWWVAALFLRTPRTRVVGDEKGVSLDDPQIEHDAKAWRFRCRVMSVVSLFTYIPFIILVVFFVRR